MNHILDHFLNRDVIVERDKETVKGKLVYVQERQMDEFRAIKVNGGIMIRDEDFLVFLKELQKFGLEVIESESEHIR